MSTVRHSDMDIDRSSSEIVSSDVSTYPYLRDVFELESELGSGTFGTTYKATTLDLRGVTSGTAVALKVFPPKGIFEYMDKIEREVAILKRLSSYGNKDEQGSQYIIQYYDSMYLLDDMHDVVYVIVMEYFEGLELDAYAVPDFIVEPYNVLNGVSLKVVYTIFEKLLDGLAFLHSVDIVHRDIKGSNIIFNPISKDLRYIDFGEACLLDTTSKINKKVACTVDLRGTPQYIAPDIARYYHEEGRDPTEEELQILEKADIWSLGIVFYEILFGEPPTVKISKKYNDTTEEYYNELSTFYVDFDKLPPYDPRLKPLVEITILMTFRDYTKRPTAEQAYGYVHSASP